MTVSTENASFVHSESCLLTSVPPGRRADAESDEAKFMMAQKQLHTKQPLHIELLPKAQAAQNSGKSFNGGRDFSLLQKVFSEWSLSGVELSIPLKLCQQLQ